MIENLTREEIQQVYGIDIDAITPRTRAYWIIDAAKHDALAKAAGADVGDLCVLSAIKISQPEQGRYIGSSRTDTGQYRYYYRRLKANF